ncbi:MAG: hypothetical protein RR827_03650 [Oscillospiraceae bacterium]
MAIEKNEGQEETLKAGQGRLPDIEDAGAVTGGFDYSSVDGETAEFLQQRENLIKEHTANYATQLGKIFTEARARLASHYQGSFGEWYATLGFSKKTVYNLIDRYTLLSRVTDTQLNLIENLPLTLSYAISEKGAPSQLVQGVMEGDITTNAEFQKLRKQLEETNSKHLEMVLEIEEKEKVIDSFKEKIIELREGKEELEEEIKELESQGQKIEQEKEQQIETMSKQRDTWYNEVTRLREDVNSKNHRLEELARQPIDVAVREPTAQELEKLAREIAFKDTEELQRGFHAAQSRAFKSEIKVQELTEQLEKGIGVKTPLTDFASCRAMASDYGDSINAFISMFLMVCADLEESEFVQAVSPIRSALTSANSTLGSAINNFAYKDEDELFD